MVAEVVQTSWRRFMVDKVVGHVTKLVELKVHRKQLFKSRTVIN